ncbi:MAG TPA: hypothetical protein VKR62_02895 [Roseiarcus sp.]|nr:hypothetical protein [Roseiarcus sp.]
MRLIALFLVTGALLAGTAQAAETTVIHRKSVGACAAFCRHPDARLEQCGSSERPVYDGKGHCSCKPDPTCASR